jgi:hypothetical protein
MVSTVRVPFQGQQLSLCRVFQDQPWWRVLAAAGGPSDRDAWVRIEVVDLQ